MKTLNFAEFINEKYIVKEEIAKPVENTEEISEKKKDEDYWVKDSKPEKGKMHKLLGIPEDEKISDHYTSSEKLAKDLLKATGDEAEASRMLGFAGFANKDNPALFRKARTFLKKKREKEEK